MKKLNPNNLFSNNSINTKQQLIDSLTAHISLYHKKSPNSNPKSNPRTPILKWFSSLSIHQRRAHVTIVDSSFVQILMQMLHKLHSVGHGFFIILPDVPSSDHLTCVPKGNDSAAHTLPSLCFRKSHGLLSRVSESNEWERTVYEATLLFNSKEGESVTKGCQCCWDAVTVSEELVENVDRFVEVMDGVSDGQFLRGEENGSGLAMEWVEFGWLKQRGYYSVEAFVVNRLELALRLAWLNSSNGGRKRGVRLIDKLNAAGMSANVFWRKKGCMDWWEKLDQTMRTKVFRLFLGKAAKSLISEILRGQGGRDCESRICSSAMEYQPNCNGISLFRKGIGHCIEGRKIIDWCISPTSVCGYSSLLDSMFHSLYILQNISALLLAQCAYNKEQIFFSSLNSAGTICDCILRKLRHILMAVSFDYTKLELLQEEKLIIPPKKHHDKLGASKRKKKGKNHGMKKLISGHTSSEDVNFVSLAKDNEFDPACNKAVDVNCNGLAKEVREMDYATEIIQPEVTMGSEQSNNGNVHGASRRSRRRRRRNKDRNKSFCGSVQARSSPARWKKDSSVSVGRQDNSTDSMAFKELQVENLSADAAFGDDKLGQVSCHSFPARANIGPQHVQRHHDSSSPGGSTDLGYEFSTRGLDNNRISKDNMGSAPASVTLSIEYNNDGSFRGRKHTNPKKMQLGSLGAKINVSDRTSIGTYDVRATNSLSYSSYEWPSVAPGHLPSASSPLPAATDRLHLEVGHNWKNHLYQSLLQPMHQVRNSLVENGRHGFVSQSLQMSLDWPPMIHGVNRIAPSVTCSYDSEFITRRQSSLQQAFTAQSVHCSSVTAEDERLYSGDFMEFPELINTQELTDEHENQWMSEEELEVQPVPGMDYNQYFGGGVMYWNPSDYVGPSFSHPPSLSSDDSSWAWREADMNRAVDDMVAFSSSYSTNGLPSPSASYCSPFDPLGPGHQALSYVISENEISGKVLHPSSTVDVVAEESASGTLSNVLGDGEAKAGDSLPCPILRPIIIPSLSRERSRSEFKRSHGHKSPCIPPNRREKPRIKRPPSPVVLCVPHAPRPPPLSPVGDSRRHRGFPTVRSGSSSPRHWGVKGWFHDGNYFEETNVRMDSSEIVWTWRNKSLSARQLTQPVPGALLQDRLIAISQLARDQEHPDVAFPLQPPDVVNCCTQKESLSLIRTLLHDEINSFCTQVAAENVIRKPYINWAVKRVARSLQVLWPRSRTNIFGSNSTGLSLPSSDVDLVVCLPPVRNLEPIKEAGILEGRNGIKETCLQHAARYLANQEWVKNDSLKIVENTAIPIIMLVVEIPHDLIASGATNAQSLKQVSNHVDTEPIDSCHTDGAASNSLASSTCSGNKNDNSSDVKSVRLDISFKSPSHTGLQTTELVKELTDQFPAVIPLALVLKQFLADRSLDQSYSGGLSSYCLVLLISRFLQHEHHHGRAVNQNYGSLLMDFFYFFGNVFDPRQMRISVQGSGLYIKRESGHSIDPLYIDDPLFPTNNVGRNCFRIHQCIKAFADAYSTLKSTLESLLSNDEAYQTSCKLLPRIIPSIGHLEGS